MNDFKPWYASKTIWGAIVSIVAALASALGMEIDGGLQMELVDAILALAAAVGGVIALIGRIVATDYIR